MYRLTYGFRRYTGNIPEVLMNTARYKNCATVSNIASVVACTTNVLGAEPFIL